MPWRSGSPQGVFIVTGAWADVWMTDTEITPLTAAAAMATVIVERKN
jgi:hypothetical protein